MASKPTTVSVLAFEKKLVPSDAFFYETNWDNRTKCTPLALFEKSVRGTISNRLKPALAKDPLKVNKEVDKPNLQRVDNCALSPDKDTLVVKFTLKVLGNIQQPSACNSTVFQESYQKAVQSYIETHRFEELGVRYATNLANGRYLWRNRLGAEEIEITITDLTDKQEQKQSWSFDGKASKVGDFTQASPEITELGGKIASTLSEEDGLLILEVVCHAKVGTAQEVYPSEELILDKSSGKGEKSKVLYSVNEIAAMHSQKVGNALRSIDTWYPDYETQGQAIAIEVYGAVTNLGKAYRPPTTKRDFYSLFDSWARGGTIENPADEHYVMAVLVRGGVFGESA